MDNYSNSSARAAAIIIMTALAGGVLMFVFTLVLLGVW